ncbi:MAG: hypothetical protein WBN88_11750, partial [Anderseniella sp.]
QTSLKVPEPINKFKDLNTGALLHRHNTKIAPLQWCTIAPAFSKIASSKSVGSCPGLPFSL